MTTAVVTGGSRGIGAEVAQRLAADGHRTVVLSRSTPEALPAGIGAEGCDVTDAGAVESTFDRIGAVDVLVNCAGISTSNPLGRTTVAEWADNMAVNATGVFLCCQAVLDGMRDRRWGRIVTVASSAGLEGGPYLAAYSASKHAAVGLMRVIAAEVDGSGVTANTVCPTFVDTDMTTATIRNIAMKTGCGLAAAEARLTALTPHGRILNVDEVAEAVLALVDSSDNGREILLDGGTT